MNECRYQGYSILKDFNPRESKVENVVMDFFGLIIGTCTQQLA